VGLPREAGSGVEAQPRRSDRGSPGEHLALRTLVAKGPKRYEPWLRPRYRTLSAGDGRGQSLNSGAQRVPRIFS
jgi:hypothetical protein